METQMGKKKILIVDDHKEFRDIVGLFIEKHIRNVETAEAQTGEEGVQMAIRQKPCIALVDIRLPKMDGLQTAQQIKEKVPRCHIILTSMYKHHRSQTLTRSNGMVFLEKSEVDDKLLPLLNTLLRAI